MKFICFSLFYLFSTNLHSQVKVDQRKVENEIYWLARRINTKLLNAANSKALIVFDDAQLEKTLSRTDLNKKLKFKEKILVQNSKNPNDPYDLIQQTKTTYYSNENFIGLQFEYNILPSDYGSQLVLQSIASVYRYGSQCGILFYTDPNDFFNIITSSEKVIFNSLLNKNIALGNTYHNIVFYINQENDSLHVTSNSFHVQKQSDFYLFLGEYNLSSIAEYYFSKFSSVPQAISNSDRISDGRYLYYDTSLNQPIIDLSAELRTEEVYDTNYRNTSPYILEGNYTDYVIPSIDKVSVYHHHSDILIELKVKKTIHYIPNNVESFTYFEPKSIVYSFISIEPLVEPEDYVILGWILN